MNTHQFCIQEWYDYEGWETIEVYDNIPEALTAFRLLVEDKSYTRCELQLAEIQVLATHTSKKA